MRRVALRIAYQGKGFCGSQYQPGLRTVVGDMMRDLQTICKGKDAEWFNIKPSSRTDAGVNALGNVVAINTEFDDNLTLLKALNSVSDSIFYTGIADVPEDFNPRYADERVYRYIMPSDGLDVDAMRKASALFIGEHDFIRFCKPDGDKPTVMSIDSIVIDETDDHIILIFRARFFLWNMVRKISSALRSVGSGKMSIDDIEDALNGKDVQIRAARPDALTLMEVRYRDLRFLDADQSVFRERVEEQRFDMMLRSDFLDSLMFYR